MWLNNEGFELTHLLGQIASGHSCQNFKNPVWLHGGKKTEWGFCWQKRKKYEQAEIQWYKSIKGLYRLLYSLAVLLKGGGSNSNGKFCKQLSQKPSEPDFVCPRAFGISCHSGPEHSQSCGMAVPGPTG